MTDDNQQLQKAAFETDPDKDPDPNQVFIFTRSHKNKGSGSITDWIPIWIRIRNPCKNYSRFPFICKCLNLMRKKLRVSPTY